MRTTALRSTLALALAGGLLAACSDVMSALNIFLVKFRYAGGGLASLILPSDIRSAANAYSACSNGSLSCATAVASLSLTSDTKAALLSGNVAALAKSYTAPDKYGMKLAFGLEADNSGNSDKASFPLSTGLNLFVQEKKAANKVTTQLPAFAVAGSTVDTIPVELPITVASVPQSSFKSMLQGQDIPYWLTGTVGFDLKSPTGETLSSGSSDLDIQTGAVSTRPSDQTVQSFLNVVATYVN